MTRITWGATALLLGTTSMAQALGLDRSGQDITAIFETGGYAELSFGFVRPKLEGVDLLGTGIDDVGRDFSIVGAAVKYDLTPTLSLGLIVDQPYGADIEYGGDPEATLLGGTAANLDSLGLTLLARYRINEAFSVHGGVRTVSADGGVTLSGLAYGAPGSPTSLNGYSVDLRDANGTGYVVGAAFERPEIALRVALTYQSAIDLDFDTSESILGIPLGDGSTEVTAPESWNLDVQTGIAADTLLFGQVRWAKYSGTILTPPVFGGATGGASITDIEDTYAVSLGVGRKITESLSGSLSVGYEGKGEDELVSPLAPTNGLTSVQVGAQYAMGQVTFTGGVRYTFLGDAQPETGTPDVARATFEGNDAVSLGLSVAYRF